MKNFRCEKCSSFFKVEDEAIKVCPKCGNQDSSSLYEISEEEMGQVDENRRKRQADNRFHLILFSVFGIIIVTLFIIILVLQAKWR